ncbi:MAG: hypothetical protein IVW51_13520 [Thermaceae bacterium]|nr:hypothetical protein [Thermaceae bacterium]
MEKTPLYLPSVHHALKAAARQGKRPVAKLVREASEYIGRKPQPKLRSMGAGCAPELGGAEIRAVFRKSMALHSVRKTVPSSFFTAMSSGKNSRNRDKDWLFRLQPE